MITVKKRFIITCDCCGRATGRDYVKSKTEAEHYYRDYGGIITRDKKHFCRSTCYEYARTKQKRAGARVR